MQRVAALLRRFAAHADRECVVEPDRSHSYGDLLGQVEARGAALEKLGVSPGDVVALRADHSFDAFATLLALLLRRNVVALLPAEPAEYRERAAEARARHVITLRPDARLEHAPLPDAGSHPLLDALRASGDAGVVLYTSGATGKPKAALQSAERLLRKYDRPGKACRTLAFLLFDHVAGLDTALYTLAAGGTLVTVRRRDPDSIVRTLARHRVEVLPASPSFLRLLCATDALERQPLDDLRIVTYGSEPMDPATLSRLNQRLPGTRIAQKYGTTETGAPRTISRANDSLWVKFAADPEIETRVRDGVLWIRSPRTILGYLNAPSPLDADGWYCTGDVVDVDGEWLRFRGRRSEAINVGGEKVSPTEVERTILELEGVTDAAVHGEPHALLGQIVTARIVLLADLPPAEWLRRVRRHCVERLPRHAVPAKIEIATGPLAGERHKKLRASAR